MRQNDAMVAPMLMLAVPMMALQAPDSVSPKYTFEAGSNQKYRLETTFSIDVSSAIVKMKANIFQNTEKVEDGVASMLVDWKDIEVTVDDLPFVFQPTANAKVGLDSKGQLVSLKSNLPFVDVPRLFTMTYYAVPSEPLKKDTALKFSTPAISKLNVPEMVRTLTYRGDETLNGQTAHKIDVVLEEKSGGLKCEATSWVLPDARILKFEGKFKNLPVPAMGATSNGSFVIQLVP